MYAHGVVWLAGCGLGKKTEVFGGPEVNFDLNARNSCKWQLKIWAFKLFSFFLFFLGGGGGGGGGFYSFMTSVSIPKCGTHSK